ncbi:hypothetical protein M3Y94_01253400 [Aphelenchoides besseyi]|nr:hypothetical protein M3Y94_01253400 [Aphelenchoides besseyi]
MCVPLFMFPFLVIAIYTHIKLMKTVDMPSSSADINFGYMEAVQFLNMNDKDFTLLKNSASQLGLQIQRDEDHYTKVEFSKFDVETPKFRYLIHTNEHEGLNTRWTNNNPFESEDGSDQSGFPTDLLKLQHTIDAILLNINNIKSADTLYLEYMEARSYKWSIHNAALPLLSVLIMCAALIPMGMIAKDVIVEVEADIKVYLLVMGMNRFSFYFSHLINGCIKMWIVMLILMAPIACTLEFTTGYALMLLIIVFSITIVTYSLFWATVLHKPGLCITVIILSAILLTVFAFVSPQNRLDFGMMCLCSLNPVFALKAGLHDLRFYDRYNMFPWPGKRIVYQFNIFFAFLFLIIDAIIIALLTFLMDAILPSSGQSGLTLSRFIKRKAHTVSDEEVQKEDFESLRRKDAEVDVSVQNLRKKWGFGEYAVNGVNFEAYRGEITCLLGHNGAGKSTVFSCLTGYTKPTSGTILVYGNNVLTQLAQIQKHVGYCPQSNPLYDRLTCSEHLRLAARLRGAQCSDVDISTTLSSVGLLPQANLQACKLSGGMKRKLCVAMALVGKSRVVLLDEPTAGMDPTARKQIGEILDKYKTDRSIVLTTHYMDEADRLSDRIVIMVKGRVVCNGTSEFLKKRFGTGFLLTISLVNGSVNAKEKAQRILGIAQHLIPEAKFTGSPAAQFTINLPYESKVKFAQLFTELETRTQELDIDSFGLSVNTLEQVFIKVGEKAEGASNEELRAQIVENANAVRQGDYERSPFFIRQWFALCIRNFIYWWRHPIRTLIPLVVILACFTFLLVRGTKSGGDSQSGGEERIVYHALSDIPRSEVFIDNSLTKRDEFTKFFASLKQCSIVHGKATKQNVFDVPPPSIGFSKQISINRFLSNGYFLALSAYSNMLYGKNSPDTIVMGVKVSTSSELNRKDTGATETVLTTFLNTVFICFGLTFGMAMLLSEVITERVQKFKHQIRLTGCRAPIYWLSQLTTDFCYFWILVVIVFTMSWVVTQMDILCSTSVLVIWTMYFLAASLASYVWSFSFESSTKGTVFILAFHTIIPVVVYLLCLIFVYVIVVLLAMNMRTQFDTLFYIRVYDFIQIALGTFFPAIPLFVTQQETTEICSRKNVTPYEIFYSTTNYLGGKTDQFQDSILDVSANRSMVALGASIILYLFLLIIIESGVFKILRNLSSSSFPSPADGTGDNDPDVVAEQQAMAAIADHELALACRGLSKFYGKKRALHDLTFGIRPSECFGLLGINGAGKTTTFDIVSNINKPSYGTATINGVSVDTTPAIGYCPQFDALSGFLTAAETLCLFGHLNGFKDVKGRVEMILECVMLKDHANKIVNKCSGGQKRRISIAVALMSGAECLLLDEPTAGVDPATRRQIWDLLTAVRLQGKAILLTTHSMEECEALCTRIGFLRDGKLQGIGTSQHLKSRYGNSYNLTFILNHVTPEVVGAIDTAVQQRFQVPPTTDSYHFASLAWVIPRRPDLKWSQMYTEVEKLIVDIHHANPNAIRDFFLIQDSLEQVFTRLSTNEAQQNAQQQTGLKNQPQQQVVTPGVVSTGPNLNSQTPMTTPTTNQAPSVNQTPTTNQTPSVNQTPTTSQTPAVNPTPTTTTQTPTPDKLPATGAVLQPSNENNANAEATKQ